MKGDKIAFFKKDPNENVARRGHCKEQMSQSHCWRRPECKDEPEINRMTNKFVEERSAEPRWFSRGSLPMSIDLLQSKQIKMVD